MATSTSTPKTIPTRILIISDTHNFQFRNPQYPLSLDKLPTDVDVLLHCGDLTNVGGLAEYRNALKMLQQIPAKLKLVIAGNHDRTLDEQWVMRSLGREKTDQGTEDELEECRKGNEIMRGPLAREAGVTYLEEGVSQWDLGNGARLRIYVSPYTPEFCAFGWAYERDEDRFNGEVERAERMKGIKGAVPIPSFGDGESKVDVVMTHGPAMGVLDRVEGGAGHVGCESLLRALERARPRLFCCGHIHEAHGAEMVQWEREEGAGNGLKKVESIWPTLNKRTVQYGKETLMVNASIMNLYYGPTNDPWYLEIDLPEVPKEDGL